VPGYLQPQLVGMEELFMSCVMSIPEYQRAYAWDNHQWEPLWADLCEGLATGTDHFLGTVVLGQTGKQRRDSQGRIVEVFEVVDGQQRLATLGLLFFALFERLRSEPIGMGIWVDFVEREGVVRLELGGANTQYFISLSQSVRDGQNLPDSPRATNCRMRDCLIFFRDKLKAIGDLPSEPRPHQFVEFIRRRLSILRFVTDNRALAIKTFQSVNDRGRPLTLLDKTKSLLMFYLTNYLHGDEETLRHIQDYFGQVYEEFDKTMSLAREKAYRVEYLVNPRYRFGEDELLTFTYHYSAKYLIDTYGLSHAYAYSLGAEKVFEDFLGPALHGLRKQPETLKHFVEEFAHDLTAVAQSLANVVEGIRTQPILAQLLQWQGLSASVYPLLIGLNVRRMLDDRMLEAISVLDLRVYKVRGTDPRAWLFRTAVSNIRSGTSYEDVYKTIIGFTRRFGSDLELDANLRHNVYRQSYVAFVLWEWAIAAENSVPKPEAFQLFSTCQVDHILPQEPMIDFSTCGFASAEEYFSEINKFGNLCLLEQELNGGAGNVALAVKADWYKKSRLAATRQLGHRLEVTGFGQQNIETRLDDVVKFFHNRRPIPPGDAAPVPGGIE